MHGLEKVHNIWNKFVIKNQGCTLELKLYENSSSIGLQRMQFRLYIVFCKNEKSCSHEVWVLCTKPAIPVV